MAKRICILFNEKPKGTHYKKGTYSRVDEAKGRKYIEDGLGVDYDPKNKRPVGVTVSMSSTKKEIEDYLDSKGIEYSENLTKAELLGLI